MTRYYADRAAPTQTSTKKLPGSTEFRMRLITALCCGLCAGLMPHATPAADQPAAAANVAGPVVIGSAGVFALVEQFGYPYAIGLQYRAAPRTAWALLPGAGITLGRDGMAYFYGDLARDFALPKRWYATLSLAAGLFLNGDGIGAREQLEFQSGLAVSRRLANDVRVGLAGYHVSNGGLSHPNNGSEALLLFVALPVSRSR
jgi:hypothetical protein